MELCPVCRSRDATCKIRFCEGDFFSCSRESRRGGEGAEAPDRRNEGEDYGGGESRRCPDVWTRCQGQK